MHFIFKLEQLKNENHLNKNVSLETSQPFFSPTLFWLIMLLCQQKLKNNFINQSSVSFTGYNYYKQQNTSQLY